MLYCYKVQKVRNNYPLIILGALIMLPAFSLAQIRYQLSNFNGEISWLTPLIIFAVIAIGIIYYREKKEIERFESWYQPEGQKGGKATKKKKERKSKSKLQ